MLRDTVFIQDLSATAITGKDAWSRPTPQPLNITVSLTTDFHHASVTDNLKYSLNYAVISRNIAEYMKANQHRNFQSLGNVAESIASVVLDESKGGGGYAEVKVRSNKSVIRAESIEYKMTRSRLDQQVLVPDEIKVESLKLLSIIGVFTFERLQKQIVDIDLHLRLKQPQADSFVHNMIENVAWYVENSNFKTVEALVMKVGQLIMQSNDGAKIEAINVKVTKPNAISFTDGVGVTSDMNADSFKDCPPIEEVQAQDSGACFNLPTSGEATELINTEHIAYIAFGSNQGDQVGQITHALRLLPQYGIKLDSTSSLYISKPMYHKDQPDFYNGVVKVTFNNKSPHELLNILKEVEYNHVGRVKKFENGPRSVDLDIILFDDVVINTKDLTIPHLAMLDRTFVMQPLCELVPPDFSHPITAEPLHNHLRQLLAIQTDPSLQESSKLHQIVPIARLTAVENPLKFDHIENKHRTLVMGILNVTPDSFSDGGIHYDNSIEKVVASARRLVQDGADIIDIGGVSTRPGSEPPTAEEELARILPVIKAIRNSSDTAVANCIISVDTYRSDVAERCLQHGADIINDISMGLYDDALFDVVARYGCPYIVNHTRGTPKTMSKLTQYQSNPNHDNIQYLIDPTSGNPVAIPSPEEENLVHGVCQELALQLLKAYATGIKKWQIIIDPGIGFAKTGLQNLSLIKNAATFKRFSMLIHQPTQHQPSNTSSINSTYISFHGSPLLLGTSRKAFLGQLCHENVPSQRDISTAASLVACVQQNTDIIRVHDVPTMKKAVVVADAIYKDLASSLRPADEKAG